MTNELVWKFDHWLRKARHGERYTYHTGYLIRDRTSLLTISQSGDTVSLPKPLDQLATAVMKAYAAGLVYPLQRKISNGQYEYIAVRS